MSRRSYGEHRNGTNYRPRVILGCVSNKASVLIPHFRSPQTKVWLRYPDGRTAVLHRGSAPPEGEFTCQRALRIINMAIARRTSASGGATKLGIYEPCPLSKKFPALTAFINDVVYDDGSKRTPGSITIFQAAEGGLRLCLNDKDSGECAFISAANLSDLMKRADEGIATGSVEWRAGRPGGKKK